MKNWFIWCLSVCLLGACGVAEMGAATAVNAKQQAEQAKLAKETADKLKQDIEAASKANEERLRKMDASAKE
jgi:hypothetical protein